MTTVLPGEARTGRGAITRRNRAKQCAVKVLQGEKGVKVSFKLYRADPELIRLVLAASTDSGETDTAKWMTAPTAQ